MPKDKKEVSKVPRELSVEDYHFLQNVLVARRDWLRERLRWPPWKRPIQGEWPEELQNELDEISELFEKLGNLEKSAT